jgi:hypothetical protein
MGNDKLKYPHRRRNFQERFKKPGSALNIISPPDARKNTRDQKNGMEQR